MQPITQDSLDPKLNDIRTCERRSINGWSDRLFRPKHPVSRDDASIPDISVQVMISTTIRPPPSSNPAPTLQNHIFSLEKRGFGDDSGDSQDDSPGAKAVHKTMICAGAAPAGMDMHK